MKHIRKILVIFFLFCSYISIIGQIFYRESHQRLNLTYSLLEPTVGAGLSFYDFNNDGLDDITIGTSDGQGILTYYSHKTFFEKVNLNINCYAQIKQIVWIDYNNDDEPDLFVSVFGGNNKLFKNTGSLKFIDVTDSMNLLHPNHNGYGATWGDINRDGWIDLYYNSRSGNTDIPNTSRLLLNTRGEYFTDITEASGTSDPNKTPFCSSFIDVNNDKWPDIYTAHDRARGNTLFINNHDGTFTDLSEVSGTGIYIDAMCVNAADVTRNGIDEIYVTNIDDGNYFLISKSGKLEYSDQALDYGIKFFGTGWGSQFLDADNDSDLDLYVSGSDRGSKVVSSLFYEQTAHDNFIALTGGGFIKDTLSSYTNAIGDFNNDGLIDIVVQNNYPEPYQLWENQSTSDDDYLKIELEGVLSNRDGIGSKIEVWLSDSSYQSHYTKVANGFLSQNSQYIHFGIGQNTIDSVTIIWPSGHRDHYVNLIHNSINKLTEGGSTQGEVSVDEDITIDHNLTTSTLHLAEAKNQLTVYPTLVTHSVVIDSDQPIHNLQIINLRGDEYLSIEHISDERFDLDLSQLPSGMYFLKFQLTRGHIVKKVIKVNK